MFHFFFSALSSVPRSASLRRQRFCANSQLALLAQVRCSWTLCCLLFRGCMHFLFLLPAGARLHSNNTELSIIIEALSFLWPKGPVARDSQACIFYESRHAASICLGTVQTRANVLLELTCQHLLLQIQLKLRITVQHIYSLAMLAALGAYGLVSKQNMRIRWVRPSFDSGSLCAQHSNLDDASQALRNARTAHAYAPQRVVGVKRLVHAVPRCGIPLGLRFWSCCIVTSRYLVQVMLTPPFLFSVKNRC